MRLQSFSEVSSCYKPRTDENDFIVHAGATQRGRREKLKARSTPLDQDARLTLNLVPCSLYLEA